MKKLISIILALSMMLLCTGFSYAAMPVPEQNNYWGYNGKTVLIDEFITDTYAMKAFYDGEIVYVITVLEDGKTEFSWASLGGTVRSLTFDSEDVSMNSGISAMNLISSEEFVESVKAYSLSHMEESTTVYEQAEATAIQKPGNVEIKGMIQADYNALMDQMEDIHGFERSWYNWTGMISNSIGGLTYEYKENLTYSMNYRDSVLYSAGMSLGAVVAHILSRFPSVRVIMSVIADVLYVAAAANTILTQTGYIAYYSGGASYTRFVLVEGGGPYCESYWSVEYDGWINEGAPGSAVLVETGEVYTPSQSLFESYLMQRQRATENYNALH